MKNFDIAFIYKDLGKGFLRISCVPKECFESIKRWIEYFLLNFLYFFTNFFSKMDLIFSTSKLNMNWTVLIKSVKDDAKAFVDQGGWTALAEESDGEDIGEESDDDSSFDEDEYKDEESESEDDDEDEDDDDDDYDEEEEEEEEEEEDVEDEDEEDAEEIVDDESEEEEEEKTKGKGRAPPKKRK